MTRKSIVTASKFGIVAFLLFALLFADGIWATSPSFVGFSLREILAVCQDAAIQWMLIFCLAIYFVVFLVLERRMADSASHLNHLPIREGERICTVFGGNLFNPNLWLASLVLLALLPYALAYNTAMHSIQMLVLLTGIVFGKAIATWSRWRCNEIQQRAVFLNCLLAGLLAVSALWQPEKVMRFQYHGISRWNGVWDNPNLYGLLMGTGLVLTVGMGIREWRNKKGGWQKILGLILSSVAIILCGIGLFKSYSRGSWLAVFAGLIYLAVQAVKSSRFSVWFHRNRVPLVLLAALLFIITFWQFRFSEQRPAQRIFSVANANDFSWRNRVTAWEGAAQMMVDRPWAGFGWGRAETDYGKKYCPPRLNDESAAIEMNDYLMIGISAGVPALFCFAAYLVLSFRRQSTGLKSLSSIPYAPVSIFTVCRSGTIVLLVGFWFDGGLFKLPVATVFWTLMELSRIESFMPLPVSSVKEVAYNDTRSSVAVVPKNGIWENRLRWLAGILAVLAVAQTAVYLGTPFLPVSDGTLAVARKCLIQRNEIEDFEFLSTNTVWHGQKLKVLLDHVRLANYNRQLINWKLDEKMYQDFVLSPVITSKSDVQLDWRRPLWEEFYLRIRHESLPEDAAKIVLKHLHERVTIAALPNPPHEVSDIWLKQITDETGFEIIYVAALRSIGVPARLDLNGRAEFWDGNNWQTAPPPSVINW